MSIFREIPPTAGWPISGKELFSASAKGHAVAGSLAEDFKQYLRIPYAEITYSGTAALYFILEGLKKISPKKSIIIPSYVCPLVPLAIIRAGLKVIACDINRDNFDYNHQQLENICATRDDILAIIAVHLAGIPVDLDRLGGITREKEIFVIEDCAQALGALYKGRPVGSIGDFSFFSLCRGKGLTIYEGGVIASKRQEYARTISETVSKLAKPGYFSEALKILELFGYWVFYRKALFWFVFGLPKMFWLWRKQDLRAVAEYYTTDFGIHAVSNFRKRVGHIAFDKLESETNTQREKADKYASSLKGIKGINIILEPIGSRATYPYFTLVFDDENVRRRIEKKLDNQGLGLSQVYAMAITDYGYLKGRIEDTGSENARYIAARQITLSTNTFLNEGDLQKISAGIKNSILANR